MNNLKNKILLLILTVYMFSTIYLMINKYILYINVINPIFWIGILAYLIYDMKTNYIRITKNKKYLMYAVIILCTQISIYFYIGFFLGFAKSPYSHKIINILKNVFIQILPIAVIELTRKFIIIRNKNNKFAITIVTIILILIEINYNTLLKVFANKEELFKYVCEDIIPLIACSILYTYLSLICSYSFSLVDRVSKEMVKILSPFLPNMDWYAIGSITILSSIIIYVLFRYYLNEDENDKRRKSETFFSKIGYNITLGFCIVLVCFMLGIFKYEPIAILSNSMVPTFSRNDVVIYKKLNESELKQILLYYN